MNNKGFTLVELLAVLVILAAITGIAIPSISSSLERNKKSQDNSRKELLKSAAELYVTDHKNQYQSGSNCTISLDTLVSEGYITENSKETSDGDFFNDICYNMEANSYSIIENNDSCICNKTIEEGSNNVPSEDENLGDECIAKYSYINNGEGGLAIPNNRSVCINLNSNSNDSCSFSTIDKVYKDACNSESPCPNTNRLTITDGCKVWQVQEIIFQNVGTSSSTMSVFLGEQLNP